MLILFIFYILSQFLVGRVLFRKLFDKTPKLFEIVGSFLLGVFVSVPVTYVFSCLFTFTGEPMLWATVVTTVLSSWFIVLRRKDKSIKPETRNSSFAKATADRQEPGTKMSDIVLVLFALIFSTWLMTKTFHGNTAGELFVGSNNVFDFAHALGIIRSFSWGANIPFMSPFQSGLPFFYNFFFYFWIAVWEHLGIPIVWAVNIPSILSFTSLLVVVYYLPQIIAKQKPIVGWIAVFLTLTNSSLTFWEIIGKKDIWRLAAYPFAGPFDGSTISIFMTLNNYVNQRHLAFAIALGLFLFLMAVRRGNSLLLRILTGVLFMWNMMAYVCTMALIAGWYLTVKRGKDLRVYVFASLFIGLLFFLPYAGSFLHTIFFLRLLAQSGPVPATWNIAEYLWQNLGLLPLAALIGFLTLRKEFRKHGMPFIVLFIVLCFFAAFRNRGFEQKSLSFYIIGINVLAAIALGWLLQRKKILTFVILAILTVSGVVDLMPIKNEFAFPLVNKETLPIITWIQSETPKNAVFVSYADMIDPVVLAGRKNYFGFFGNIGGYDRTSIVKQVYQGDSKLANANGISYVLAPKFSKSDFPYEVAIHDWPVAYEDNRFVVFAVTQ